MNFRWMLLPFVLLWLGRGSAAQEPVAGGDPRQAFVEGLRQSGLAELAVLYLRSVPSALEPGPLVDRRDYELGKSLLDSAEAGPREREQATIDEAVTYLRQYRDAHPETDEGLDARGEIASVDLSRAQRLLAEAAQASEGELARKLRSKALEQLRQAGLEIDQIVARYQQLLSAETSSAEGSKVSRRRGQSGGDARAARRILLQGRQFEHELRRGIVEYLSAQAYDSQVEEEKKLADARLDRAISYFNDLFQKYRATGTLAASYALLWEGRSRQERGEWETAEEIYEEVLGAEPTQANRVDKLRADLFAQARLFWCQVQNRRGQPREILDNRHYAAPPWLERLPSRRRERPGLGIQLELAKAYFALAEEPSADAKQARRLLRDGMDLLTNYVCRYSSEFMPEGFALREKYASRVATDGQELTSFDEAMFVARSAGAAEDWPKAIAGYQRALALVDKDTPRDSVAETQYRLAAAQLRAGETAEALSLAQSLADQEPMSKFSAEGAGLVLSARWKLYREARSAGSEEEALAAARKDLTAIFEQIEKRFPRSPSADNARFLRGVLLGEERAYEASAAAYQEIGPESANFAESRLRAAQILGAEDRSREGADPVAAKRVSALLTEAIQAFDQKRTDPDEPVLGWIEAKLEQAKLLLATGESLQALAQVEELMPWLEKGRPVGIDRLAVDLLTTVINSALAANQWERAAHFVDRALVESEGGRSDSLAGVLIRLGRGLREESARLQAAGRADEALARRKSLDDFLVKWKARPQQTLASLRFLAETYESLGEPALAAEALARWIERVQAEQNRSPERDKELIQLQLRRVRALRLADDFETAGTEVEQMLETHRASGRKSFPLAIEFARCEVLDARGERDPQRGGEALSAWIKLADSLRGMKVKPREFFVARLASARWTAKLKGPGQAVPLVRSTLTLHPEAGGPELRQEFERLLREWEPGGNR